MLSKMKLCIHFRVRYRYLKGKIMKKMMFLPKQDNMLR